MSALNRRALLAIFACAVALISGSSASDGSTTPIISLNDHANFHYFAAKLSHADTEPSSLHRRAEDIASDLGYRAIGRVGQLPDYVMFAKEKTATEKQRNIKQRNRDLSEADTASEEPSEEAQSHAEIIGSVTDVAWVQVQIPKTRLYRRGPVPDSIPERDSDARGGPLRIGDIMTELSIADPGFMNQWHLVNQITIGNDLNVTGVWKQGITGHNATVCFVDDGLDHASQDLAANFYAAGSYDYNTHQADPKPKLAADRHGTRCAGEVAAVRNDVCGVGVAYDAQVSGVRILGGPLTEADEAAAINFDYQNNDIYSCSWGPSDDGQAMDAPPKIVTDAVTNGITNGRSGLGSIFVFASGNGAAAGDHCNADGYTNSIYTITVGALDHNNKHPSYSEACSAVMIVMYSSNGQHGDAIYTTDWPGDCTSSHGGTSAAAPLASGLYALVLQIRPDLSWRDIQHLTVRTAVPIDLADSDWSTTAAGRLFNNKYGYGKLDGWALVEAAKTFKTVGMQTVITPSGVTVGTALPADGTPLSSTIEITSRDVAARSFIQTEHVTVKVWIDHQSRGDVAVSLVSPNGITSELAVQRPADRHTGGYHNWTFMSVKHWGEDPVGTWTLKVSDMLNPSRTGTLRSWALEIWGESSSTTPGADVDFSEGGVVSPPQPSASSSSSSKVAVIFGLGAVGCAGGAFLWIRRRQIRQAAAGKNPEEQPGFEFEMLNGNELTAAFHDEEDDADMRPVGLQGKVGESRAQLVNSDSELFDLSSRD
ncbi:pheromone processing endoprotease [Thoreauomyces humboldtii]|nr:pheromone processing endoprotease [Thoreauomyces humboldtii]